MYENGQKFNSIKTPLPQVRMFHNLRSVPPEGQNLHHGQPFTQDSPSSSLQGPVRNTLFLQKTSIWRHSSLQNKLWEHAYLR